jgi:hypothetical protein
VSKSKLKPLQVAHSLQTLSSSLTCPPLELDLSVLEAVEAYQEEKELQQQQQDREDETKSDEDDDAPRHQLNRKMFVLSFPPTIRLTPTIAGISPSLCSLGNQTQPLLTQSPKMPCHFCKSIARLCLGSGQFLVPPPPPPQLCHSPSLFFSYSAFAAKKVGGPSRTFRVKA